ncbi:hypothetical protein TKK_0003592 [Trichogramma kaykai]
MNRADFIPTDANLGLLQGLMEAGLSNTVIGERLGINRSTVWRWRARLNADFLLEDGRRGNSGVQKINFVTPLIRNLTVFMRKTTNSKLLPIRTEEALTHLLNCNT